MKRNLMTQARFRWGVERELPPIFVACRTRESARRMKRLLEQRGPSRIVKCVDVTAKVT